MSKHNLSYCEFDVVVSNTEAFQGIQVYRGETLLAMVQSDGKVLLMCIEVKNDFENLIRYVDKKLKLWDYFTVRKKMFTFFFHGGMVVESIACKNSKTRIAVSDKSSGKEHFVIDLDDMSIVRDTLNDPLVVEIITQELQKRIDTLRQNRPKHIMEVFG